MHLKINDLKQIGKGCSKIVFQHPHDQNKVIKIMNPERVSKFGGFNNHSKFKQRFAQGIYRHFRRELIQYLQLCKLHYKANSFVFPVETPYGFVETNQGIGLVVEKIVSPNQQGVTLYELCEQHLFEEKHEIALKDFFDACCDLHIVFGEVNIAGIMYTEQRSNKPEFVLVDGMGEKLFIPLRKKKKKINAQNIRKVEFNIRKKMEQLLASPPL